MTDQVAFPAPLRRSPPVNVAIAMIAMIACMLGSASLVSRASAQTVGQEDQQPVLLQADEVTYDERLRIVTARGGVELTQGDRVLIADVVTYNQDTDTATASGNVSLLEPSGEVLFSDYAELNNALKTGFVDNLRGLLADGSRFAANRAQRVQGEKKIMNRAVFSPCKPCEEDPSAPPVWQIKAVRVIHDERRQNIEYKDATFELFGFPIAYTPYFEHPDPNVKRRTGLLAPTMGYSDELGFIFGQPYFWAIDQSKDLEIEPIFYSNEGTIIRTRYRQRFANGAIDFSGTGAYLDNREGDIETGDLGLEGSADLQGRFALNDTWRGGFDFEQSSRRTYLRRYRLSSDEVLTSQVFTEGFRGRNYASARALKFQGLRPSDDRDRSPIVAPIVEYNHVGAPSRFGGRFEVDATAMSLSRIEGSNSRKVAVRTGWSLPHVGSAGEVTTMTASLRSDVYYAANADLGGDQDSETTGRLFPQLGLNWRYPLARRGENFTQVIEPIVGIVAGANGGNPDAIPNEDSQTFEFDDTNLFSMNRFDGSDRVTSGSRVDYGVKMGVYGDNGGSSSLMIGQSYRFYGDGSAFEKGSGVDDDLSDIVGRIQVSPTDRLDLLYRFRIDTEDLTPRRNELGIRLSYPRFNLSADYIVLDEEASSTFNDREQLDATLNLRLSDSWNMTSRLVQDLTEGSTKTLIGNLGFVYSNDCMSIGLSYERRDLQDADIEPEDRFFLRVSFKYLGAIESF